MRLQLRNHTAERFDYATGIGSGGCSDIDMVWERHGHFLIIENKRKGEAISQGQMIMLRQLQALPNFTVVVAVGTPPDAIESFGVLGQSQVTGDVDLLRSRIQKWWDAH